LHEFKQTDILAINIIIAGSSDRHKYAKEVSLWSPNVSQLSVEAVPEIVADDVAVYWIDNNRLFWFFMEKIKNCHTICIDVEANDWEGYYGWTCLIQISVAGFHFILDCMKIPQEIEDSFSKVMESSNILKIFHGGCNDLMWLQRDFKIYTWPVLDTQIVSQVFEGKNAVGFAELTKNYLGINISKEEKTVGQLSDYRYRPLHQDLIRYACNDSRYLLAIWNRLKEKYFGAGLTSSKVESVVNESRKLVLSSLWKADMNKNGGTSNEDGIFHSISLLRAELAKKLNISTQTLAKDTIIMEAIKQDRPPTQVHPELRRILQNGWKSKSFQTIPTMKECVSCMK
jgi:ribonuclease D